MAQRPQHCEITPSESTRTLQSWIENLYSWPVAARKTCSNHTALSLTVCLFVCFFSWFCSCLIFFAWKAHSELTRMVSKKQKHRSQKARLVKVSPFRDFLRAFWGHQLGFCSCFRRWRSLSLLGQAVLPECWFQGLNGLLSRGQVWGLYNRTLPSHLMWL